MKAAASGWFDSWKGSDSVRQAQNTFLHSSRELRVWSLELRWLSTPNCRLLTFPGIRWRNCGASGAQTQLSVEQNAFYQELTSAYSTAFAGQQAILSSLTSEF